MPLFVSLASSPATVTVSPLTLVVIPSPPATVKVSLVVSALVLPLSPATVAHKFGAVLVPGCQVLPVASQTRTCPSVGALVDVSTSLKSSRPCACVCTVEVGTQFDPFQLKRSPLLGALVAVSTSLRSLIALAALASSANSKPVPPLLTLTILPAVKLDKPVVPFKCA